MVLLNSITLSGVLRCVSEFEELTGRFYDDLSKKFTSKSLSVVFKWISRESFNHAMLMKDLINLLELPSSGADCSEVIGEPWFIIDKLRKKVLEAHVIDLGTLNELLSSMRELEDFVGEETYGKILYPAVNSLLSDLGSNSKEKMRLILISDVLKEVAVEEEYHEKLIKLITELLKETQ